MHRVINARVFFYLLGLTRSTAQQRAQRLRDKIQSILSDNRRGEIVRAGIRLAIFGPPNVGKSSLLNFLGTRLPSCRLSPYPLTASAAQREAAIVTHVPGTTRDILELSLDIGGLPVSVADTAGLRETIDEVEQIGIERARRLYDPLFCNWRCARRSSRCYRVQVTDASILVLSFPDAVSVTPSGPRLEIPAELAPLVTANTFILLNKSDLLPTPILTAASSALPRSGCWAVSLASQSGTDEFLAGLATELQDRYGGFLNVPPYSIVACAWVQPGSMLIHI